MNRALLLLTFVWCVACSPGKQEFDGGLEAADSGTDAGSNPSDAGSNPSDGGASGTDGGLVQGGPPAVFVISHNETGSVQQVTAFGLPAKTAGAVTLTSDPGTPIAVISSRDGAKVAVIGARDDGMGNISDFAISLGGVSGPLQQTTLPSTVTLSFLNDSSAAWYERAEDLGLWSPDNSRLALAARYVGADSSRVFVMDANGANVTEVAPVFGGGMRELSRTVFWTADSSALVFLRQRNLLPLNFATDIGAWTPSGGAHIYAQSDSVAATEAAIQPGGGDRFAFVQGGRLFLARASETTATPVTPSNEWVKGIGWSPDGQRLAYITAADNSSFSTKQIVIINADGSNLQPVTFGGSSAEKAFAFSPDSQHIAYLSDEVNPGHTMVFEMNGKTPSIIARVQVSGDGAPGAVPDVALAWSADGQRMAFGWRDAPAGPMSLKIATEGAASSAIDGSSAGTVVTSGAKWSPNGHDALGYKSKETSGLKFEHLWMVSGTGGTPLDLGVGLPVLNWWWSRSSVLVGWLQAGNQRVVMAAPGATEASDVIVGGSNQVLVYVNAN